MNLFKSIVSRYSNLKIEHFGYFYGKELKKMYNLHENNRCFIIGNGPSLRASDLTRIYEHNDITFAFNRIFYMFPNTIWRPTYYISQDDKMLKGCIDEIKKMDVKKKFIPIEMNSYYGMDFDFTDFTPFHLVGTNSKYPEFSEDISKFLVNSNTVVYTAIQFAVYMGFKEIYLLGVDHHFHISQNDDGDIIMDSTVKDYFTESYNKDKDNLYIPNLDRSFCAYVSAYRNTTSRGVKIYNATRGGKLEVFERVDFDALF